VKQTILVIEDENRIAQWIRTYLEEADFRVLIAAEGKTGLHLARTEHPDLLILDLMLPGMDGMDVCRVLRQDSDVPIIMLTARSKVTDRIVGLELGADDYMVKPFDPGELVARVRSKLRRSAGEIRQPEMLRGGNICLDMVAHTCTVEDNQVELSRTQFDLLATLMRRAGRAMTRDELLNAAFKEDNFVFDRNIDVHIRRLRQRVEEDPANPQHIVTVFGVGYKFVEL
jgi:DNA-binding response OmpR family regulator